MQKNLSVYLELVRWLAAMGVFISHSREVFAPWLPWSIASNAQQCVAVFFVLSGFVIRYVSTTKEHGWRPYTVARVARLYSVVLVAIAFTLFCDHLGTRFNANAYLHQSWFNSHPSIGDFISYLSFTNEVWFRHVIVGSDEPYWSLGFEVAYYIAFAFAVYPRWPWRLVLLMLWALVSGPKIVVYLPLWLIGVVTYEITKSRALQFGHERLVGIGLFLASFALYHLNEIILGRIAIEGAPTPHSFGAMMLTAGYLTIVGIAASTNLIGFDFMTRRAFTWPPTFVLVIRWLAGASFTLYLTHVPMLAASQAIFTDLRQRPILASILLVIIFIATLVLAEVGERRKLWFRGVADLIVPHDVPELSRFLPVRYAKDPNTKQRK